MARRSSVALHYDSRLPAPLVVARGKGELAERMNALAREHGIPVVDAPEVAEALVLADPGDFIPEAFYEAIAEILGFVWRSGAQSTGKKVGDEEHQGQ
jgi:type III secretion system FlhB-like substrate exporter